ncbi:hypothetical protein ACFWBI_39630 [Streptomyces sp. NPDC059982]|uniref:hypothetical protein n=1 Tax=unclassified Streptomyces TaxID=2593676 RepID=UPI0036A20003
MPAGGDGAAAQDRTEAAFGQPVAAVRALSGTPLQLGEGGLAVAGPEVDHRAAQLADSFDHFGVRVDLDDFPGQVREGFPGRVR